MIRRNIKKYCLMMTVIMLVLVSGCKPPLNRYQSQFLEVFHTASQVIGYAPTEVKFQEQAERIHQELEQYHQLYDIYHNYEGINNLKTINDQAGIRPVEVDSRIIDLLLEAKRYYYQTEGYVNIAFGSVLSLWHQYREAGIANPAQAQLPPLELLREAAKHTNIEDLIIDTEAKTVFLKDPQMSLDVGAIAKGYATEQVSRQFDNQKDIHLLLSIGGNIKPIGTKPDGKPWVVGIQNPDVNQQPAYLRKIPMLTTALVTSGDYQRYYAVDGIFYHHLINQHSLMPSNYYRSVSVITEDAGYADALSTALFNMEYELGKQLVQELGDIEVVWIFADGSIESTTTALQE